MANSKPELDCTTCALGDVITVTSLQKTDKLRRWSPWPYGCHVRGWMTLTTMTPVQPE